ncbi:outer membrane lipoprotein-sorting protein [ANME-2 cluster archaeon]|nr:MAG: outer membrane lipoprotein-sorting protein [ANME-2 cluster archaeon]
MKRLLLITIIAISLVITGCVSNELTSEQIKDQMRAHEDSVRDLICTMLVTSNNETMVANYTYKYPDMIRMEYKKHPELAGQIMVSNGTYMWMYDPASNSVETASIPAYARMNLSKNAQLIENLLDAYTITPNGTGIVSGRECYRITATPIDVRGPRGPISIELWLDQKNWMPIKIETYQNNTRATCMEYRDIRFNTGIPNSTFEFKIPEGATVESVDNTPPAKMTLEEAQAKVLFGIKEPKDLPQGYALDNIMTAPVSASETGVILVYTNTTEGDPSLAQSTAIQLIESAHNESVKRPTPAGENETIMIGEHKCTITAFGKSLVLQWDDGEREFVLGGTLDREELIRIAKSI